MPDAARLYDHLRKRVSLQKAWSVVRDNGFRSTSSETREDVKRYAADILRHLSKLQIQLRKGHFVFQPARGILIAKKGKSSKRPVVIAPIPSRIVQRAILDVVQAIPEIYAQLHAGFNFGGIEGSRFGVPAAVKKAFQTSQTHDYYIRTDIKSFFTAVPRQKALDKIIEYSRDSRFNDFLVSATNTELQDLKSFGENQKLFPLAEEGVAQGSCLSPLLCNLLLSEFDREMNSRGIVCIRYIDDYIIFGPDQHRTAKAFQSSLKKLKALGLDAYDPFSGDEAERRKADHGLTANDFGFLGCDIRKDRIRPSTDNRKKLLGNVKNIFDNSLVAIRNPLFALHTDNNFVDSMKLASETIRGWGNTYSFCTDDQLMRNIDTELQKLFDDYESNYFKRIAKYSGEDKRRAYGLFPLVDCNKS